MRLADSYHGYCRGRIAAVSTSKNSVLPPFFTSLPLQAQNSPPLRCNYYSETVEVFTTFKLVTGFLKTLRTLPQFLRGKHYRCCHIGFAEGVQYKKGWIETGPNSKPGLHCKGAPLSCTDFKNSVMDAIHCLHCMQQSFLAAAASHKRWEISATFVTFTRSLSSLLLSQLQLPCWHNVFRQACDDA